MRHPAPTIQHMTRMRRGKTTNFSGCLGDPLGKPCMVIPTSSLICREKREDLLPESPGSRSCCRLLTASWNGLCPGVLQSLEEHLWSCADGSKPSVCPRSRLESPTEELWCLETFNLGINGFPEARISLLGYSAFSNFPLFPSLYPVGWCRYVFLTSAEYYFTGFGHGSAVWKRRKLSKYQNLTCTRKKLTTAEERVVQG